jgi:Ca-activated chloride channel family protein
MGFGSGDRSAINAIFNPAWGVREKPSSRGFVYPEVEVIDQALNLYQGVLRVGSVTALVIDKSGSMSSGAGQRDATGKDLGFTRIKAVKNAAGRLIDPEQSAAIKLQASSTDTFVVFPFTDGLISGWRRNEWTVHGNNPDELKKLNAKVQALEAGGGTDMYSVLLVAFAEMDAAGIGDRLAAIILLTDGESGNQGLFPQLAQLVEKRKLEGKPNIPIHAIAIGEAGRSQLESLTKLTGGLYVDARVADLEAVFRRIRGEN